MKWPKSRGESKALLVTSSLPSQQIGSAASCSERAEPVFEALPRPVLLPETFGLHVHAESARIFMMISCNQPFRRPGQCPGACCAVRFRPIVAPPWCGARGDCPVDSSLLSSSSTHLADRPGRKTRLPHRRRHHSRGSGRAAKPVSASVFCYLRTASSMALAITFRFGYPEVCSVFVRNGP